MPVEYKLTQFCFVLSQISVIIEDKSYVHSGTRSNFLIYWEIVTDFEGNIRTRVGFTVLLEAICWLVYNIMNSKLNPTFLCFSVLEILFLRENSEDVINGREENNYSLCTILVEGDDEYRECFCKSFEQKLLNI